MTKFSLSQLQASLQDKSAFGSLEDYATLCYAYLVYLQDAQPTRIIAPNEPHYVFFQYDERYAHKITRPLNSNLYIESAEDFKVAFERFGAFLDDLRRHEAAIVDQAAAQAYLASNELSALIYTLQQTAGNIEVAYSA